MIDESVAPSSRWAFAFLGGLIERGVRDVVLSPGSRSQALALVAAAFADRQLLNLHIVIDERVGSYLALGLAVETKRPVAIVVTSGTAVANLHPGVLEAHHAGIPLIVVTADRPAVLRTTGANQTTVHVGAFGVAARKTIDIPPPGADALQSGAQWANEVVTAAVTESGPIHVNAQFVEPLSSSIDSRAYDTVRQGELPDVTRPQNSVGVVAAPGTIVVAGYGAGPRAEKWARDLGAPLIAEVSSGAHFGPHLVTDYRRLLSRSEFADAIQSVVVVGRPTLSAPSMRFVPARTSTSSSFEARSQTRIAPTLALSLLTRSRSKATAMTTPRSGRYRGRAHPEWRSTKSLPNRLRMSQARWPKTMPNGPTSRATKCRFNDNP